MHSMQQYDSSMNDPSESVWRFTLRDSVSAEAIAKDLRDTGLTFEVTQGYHVPKRGKISWSATVTFQGTPRQAEALFRAIVAKPWGVEDMRVEAYPLSESAEVVFG